MADAFWMVQRQSVFQKRSPGTTLICFKRSRGDGVSFYWLFKLQQSRFIYLAVTCIISDGRLLYKKSPQDEGFFFSLVLLRVTH